jgi:phosphoribosylformylglycinamidine (FGAM) synthase-like enzyme
VNFHETLIVCIVKNHADFSIVLSKYKSGNFKTVVNMFISESFSRAVVEVRDEKAFEELAENIGLSVKFIGKTGGDKLIIDKKIDLDVAKIQELYFNSFKKLIEQDL